MQVCNAYFSGYMAGVGSLAAQIKSGMNPSCLDKLADGTATDNDYSGVMKAFESFNDEMLKEPAGIGLSFATAMSFRCKM